VKFYASDDAKRKPEDLCTCGSGKIFSVCHGDDLRISK